MNHWNHPEASWWVRCVFCTRGWMWQTSAWLTLKSARVYFWMYFFLRLVSLCPSTTHRDPWIHSIYHHVFGHCLGINASLRTTCLTETGPKAEYGNLSSFNGRGDIDKFRERLYPCLLYITLVHLFQSTRQPSLQDMFILSKSWKKHTHSQPLNLSQAISGPFLGPIKRHIKSQESDGEDSGANARVEADWTLLWLHMFVHVPGISGTSHGSQTHWSLEPRFEFFRSCWHICMNKSRLSTRSTSNTWVYDDIIYIYIYICIYFCVCMYMYMLM